MENLFNRREKRKGVAAEILCEISASPVLCGKKINTMKQLIIVSILFFLYGNSYSQDTNCTQYHRGKFTYIDSANNVIIVKRKKNFQVETNQTTNVWINFRITWINDCEYQLEQVGTNSKARRKYNHTFTTTIISKPLGETGYEYTCACKDPAIPKITGVMKKVPE